RRWLWIAGGCVILLALFFGANFLLPQLAPRVTGSKQLTNDGLQKGELVTDGNRIYFNESNGNGERTIGEVSVAGGEVRPLPLTVLVPAISDIPPDGSQLLGSGNSSVIQPLVELPLPAGALRPIGDLKGRSPAVAPEGNLIYALPREIFTADHDGAN